MAFAFPDPALPAPRHSLVLEKGFRVKHYDECGTFGVRDPEDHSSSQYPRLPIEDLECSPGGPWGRYAYLVLTPDPADGLYVDIERVRFNGKAEYFTSVDFAWYGGHLAFAPLGWSRGDILFATTRGSGIMRWILPSGGWDPRYILTDGLDPGPMAADPDGDFGGDLYYADGGAIHRVDAAGNVIYFAQPPSIGSEMRFGPGGPWGTDLYTGGSVIAPDGAVTPFPVLFDEFDWAFGPGFEGDMFAVASSAQGIDRIGPDGSRTRFATIAARHLAFCDGSLWLARSDGCWAITSRGPRQR